jgi:dolichol kinase
MSVNLFSDNLAWLWDIIVMVVTMVLLLGVVKINGKIQEKGKLPTYVTRKIIHIVAAPIFLLMWFFYSGNTSSRYIALIVPLLFMIQFTAIGTGLLKDEDFIRSMSRTGDPKELLKGTLYYAVIMLIVSIFYFYIPSTGINDANPAGFIIIGCLAGGDGFADIIGRKFGGDKKFGIAGAEKTIAGSIGMFLGSFIFSIALIAIYSLEVPNFDIGGLILPVLIISIVVTFVEAFSPPNLDNLTIPVVVFLIILLFAVIGSPWWPYSIFTL